MDYVAGSRYRRFESTDATVLEIHSRGGLTHTLIDSESREVFSDRDHDDDLDSSIKMSRIESLRRDDTVCRGIQCFQAGVNDVVILLNDSSEDKNVRFTKDLSHYFILGVYRDDLIIAVSTQFIVETFKSQLLPRFQLLTISILISIY